MYRQLRPHYSQAIAGVALGSPLVNANPAICALVGAVIGSVGGYMLAKKAHVPVAQSAGVGAAVVALLAYLACRQDAVVAPPTTQKQPAYYEEPAPGPEGYVPIAPVVGPSAGPPGVRPGYVTVTPSDVAAASAAAASAVPGARPSISVPPTVSVATSYPITRPPRPLRQLPAAVPDPSSSKSTVPW